jgi:Thiamine pyrophosphate enzyme, C-terminal TPP binding domain
MRSTKWNFIEIAADYSIPSQPYSNSSPCIPIYWRVGELPSSFWGPSGGRKRSCERNLDLDALGSSAGRKRRDMMKTVPDQFADFLSLAQLKLPVKVVVFNNGALGFIELEQKSTGFLDCGTELVDPNFAAMAEAVGIRGIRLQDAGEVDEGIAAAFAHDGPVLIDAVVNRTELAMPPAITVEMAKGFSLYMVKAVLNGRVDEVVDLAKTNLWR